MGRKKKRQSKTQRKEIRLQKARQWILTYDGTPKHMARSYRKRFHVDIMTAVSDLQAIGVEFTQEYLDAVKCSEEERLRQKRLKREQKKAREWESLYEDSDDTFAFIAGYTGGGAPHGITWEELGLEPYASYDELMEAYDRMDALAGIEEEGEPMTIRTIEPDFSVCKVRDYSQVDLDSEYCFIGKTDEENSLVCTTDRVPDNVIEREDGWKAFRIEGILDFSLVGILYNISALLAENEIGIFAISTYNTDYILTKREDYPIALEVLSCTGYHVV